jgi:hypothetical protein
VTSPAKPSAPLSKAEFTAMGTIARARRDNLDTMFKGARVVYGKESLKELGSECQGAAKDIHEHAAKLFGGAKSLGGGVQARVLEVITQTVGVENFQVVVDIAGPVIASELVKQMTPWIGLIYSGGKAAQAWKEVVDQARHHLKFDAYRRDIIPGDPQLACDAVKVILERNIARDTVTATIETTAFATKALATIGDFGTGTATTVVGLASAMASLAVQLTQLGIDIRELRAGNRFLKEPGSIDKRIFSACPLVGSYLIAYSPSSMLLNFFVADMGLPGWMDKIESFQKRSLDPLVDVAVKQIERSRISLTGFQTGKGFVADKSFGDKLKDLNWKSFKFQFNRRVRSKLPF